MLAIDYNRSKRMDKLTMVMSPANCKSADTNYDTIRLNSNTFTPTDYKNTKKEISYQIDNTINQINPDYSRRLDRLLSSQ